MDNEKFQEFMAGQFAKMFKELQNFKKDVTTEFANVKFEINSMKTELSEVKKSQLRMENDFGKKLDILYHDWRETQKQFNEEVKSELQILSTKVEALQMESTKHDLEIKNLYLVKASKE